MSSPPTKIAIAGAGLAGMEAAKVLSQADNVEVLLIDRNSSMVFIPMLYQVATRSLKPEQIAYPIRHRFRRWPQVTVVQAKVAKVDFEQQHLWANSATALKFDYDYLILAMGSQSQFLGVPGASQHSFPMRTLAEAVALRDRISHCLGSNPAHQLDPTDAPSPALTFTVVGGGATGVELAGALAQLLQQWGYRLGQTARVVLVQSGDRLLKSYPAKSGDYAASYLRRRGVELRLGQKVSRVTAQTLELEGDAGQPLETHTVIWTAGLEAVRPNSPQAIAAGAQNKLKVSATLQLQGSPNAYAVGDLSQVAGQEAELNGVAQEAIQQGRTAAQNILRQRSGQAPAPFDYNNKGRLAIIGRGAGVGLIKGIELSGKLGGALAWLLWLEVHWLYLPGWRNRFSVLGSWLSSIFSRSGQSLNSHIPPQSRAFPMGIQTYLPLVGRTFLSSIFVYAGLNNLLNFSSTVERIGGMLPAPSLALAGNILCCLLGSLSLILGFKARWGAVLLILFLVPTNLIFHQFWNDGSETIPFLKNLSLIGALLFVNAYGAGPISVDGAERPVQQPLYSSVDRQ